jgi:Holliday junction resolvase RusA-like endonuclease
VADALELTIHGRPPSWNAAYRARKSYIYMTRDAKQWKKIVSVIASAAKAEQQWECGRDTMLVVDVWIYVKRGIDADNILKLTLDAIALGIGVNDARFMPRVWALKKKGDEEKLVLRISEVVEDD